MQVIGIDGSTQGIVNIRDFGAAGNGVTNDTAAIQDALFSTPRTGVTWIPPGVYLFSAPLEMLSGRRFGGPGTLKAAPISAWLGSPYYGITNENRDASVITDENIQIFDLTMDYTNIPASEGDGTQHTIYIRKARDVRIENITTIGGASATALLGCDNTIELGNTYLDFRNCGPDAWDGPRNRRVIGCHIESGDGFSVAQMVNFNPNPTSGPSTGYVADGFVFKGNTVISHETSATPCQIEQLVGAGASVRNVVVSGNVFVNSYLVLRGDVSGAVIDGNTFSNFQGNLEAITSYPRSGGNPGVIIVSNNIIRDPHTDAGVVGVIRVQSDKAQIFNNFIFGTDYTAAPIYTGAPTVGQIFGNHADVPQVAGHLQTGMIIPNGSANFYGWTDTGGAFLRMLLQSDNNWVMLGTNAAGNPRTIAGMFQRSNTSDFIWEVPVRFRAETRYTPTLVAATGTNIGTAASLSAATNYVKVTSCTTGVADGVALSANLAKPQTITNATADPLNVYPNNSGFGTINGGAVGAPVVLAPGKSMTLFQHEDNSFWVVSDYA